MRRSLLMLLSLLLALPVAAADPSDYMQTVERQRQAREAGLKRPLGWLSLVGLHWIEPGRHALGSSTDNGIVLAVGPARLGTVVLADDTVTLEPVESAMFLVDGAVAEGAFVLKPDSSGAPTQVTFDEGRSGFNLIERDGRFALRVRDSQARALREFSGLDFYPVDADWRAEARFEPHAEGSTIEIANVINQLQPMPNPGALVFERDGRTHRIEAIGNDDGSLSLIFADRTSGRETYGAGRFLDTAAPRDGVVTVDFNLAYNPPCAFNDYSTCPLPPPENRLDLAVTAGEKKYIRPQ
ncbi:DUF1684 domain-containing protein [Xanthomonadaceae bacterium JHOS43]|nr:DUF1684 domain-containing protein [Xanthomonadaceae bacterium JHOS43]MCX7563592.1 DUF1684 domain-containing protein [Xanthomonadaceae bacterium XH05]